MLVRKLVPSRRLNLTVCGALILGILVDAMPVLAQSPSTPPSEAPAHATDAGPAEEAERIKNELEALEAPEAGT